MAANRRGPDPKKEADAAARAVLREEADRMAEMGAALSRIAAASQKVADAGKLAAIQDKNLAAYERMVEDAGAHALAKAHELAAMMATTLEKHAAGDASEAAAPLEGVEAAIAEIRAARDARTEEFLGDLADRLGANAAPDKHAEPPEDGLEPFE